VSATATSQRNDNRKNASEVGVIVPQRLRADWRREWEAELRRREELLAEWDRLDWRNKLDLLRRSASAFWDALWLQPKRWEDEMFQDLRFSRAFLRGYAARCAASGCALPETGGFFLGYAPIIWS
jgi:hypothetical protein